MRDETKGVKGFSKWYLLLLLSFAGLLFPQLYARETPALWGFPFFYWYQFLWVILSSIITAIVYVKTDSKRAHARRSDSRSGGA